MLLADLPASADPCGERGEFHTFLSEGPNFTTLVSVTRGQTVLREERFAYCDLMPTERR
jgi:diphthamide synthase (EF-2-diphthine--ammonia ligase)